MKTIRLFIITSLFFFLLADANAQNSITNYGLNSGTTPVITVQVRVQ